MAGRWGWIAVSLILLGSASVGLALDEVDELYLNALRQRGYADFAVDFLEMKLEDKGLTTEDRASIEFDIASATIDLANRAPELQERERLLEASRKRFADFVERNPRHPRVSESLSEVATIDLQRGRLKVLLAQLPANESQVANLAEEARQFLRKAIGGYDTAYDGFKKEYDALPVYIPPEDRKARRAKSALFRRMIDARFQSGLSRYYLADSYQSIPMPGQGSKPGQASAVGGLGELAEAEKIFATVHREYRQFLVGQLAKVWEARCMDARGERKLARILFDEAMNNTDPQLAAVRRVVFWFQMLSFASEGRYDEIITLGEAWLRQPQNLSHRTEQSYLGTQFEVAKAYVARGEKQPTEIKKRADFQAAVAILGRLSVTINEYQGLAKREQLRIESLADFDSKDRSFPQLAARGNARLDDLKPGMSPEEKLAILREVQGLFQAALEVARPTDKLDDVTAARLQLIFAYLEAGDLYEAAILAEHTARVHAKSSFASEAGYFGVLAYARAFDEANERAQQGEASEPEVDARYLLELADYVLAQWPQNKNSDNVRILAGTFEFNPLRRNYVRSAQIFDDIDPEFPRIAESTSLAGRAFWEAYRQSIEAGNVSAQESTKLRDSAIDRLSRAKSLFRGQSGPRERFLAIINDAVLAEVYFDAGQLDQSIATVRPLVEAISSGKAPDDLEASVRISILLTALQALVQAGRMEEAVPLVDLVGKQQGAGADGNVTVVFLNLATRIKEQIDRYQAAGDTAAKEKLVQSFEGFLQSLADRSTGQTLQSMYYLANLFLEIGKPKGAVQLSERILAAPDNAEYVLPARLLQARAMSKAGQHDEAVAAIDKLLSEHLSAMDLIMARGEILMAAGKNAEAIAHYKWFMKQVARKNPKPDEFYQAIEQLLVCFTRVPAKERPARIQEGRRILSMVLNQDESIPPQWRARFEEQFKRLTSQVTAAKQ